MASRTRQSGQAYATGVTPPVTSITGTANQISASQAQGAVILSLPQSIATTSSPTFDRAIFNTTNSVLIDNGSASDFSALLIDCSGSGTSVQPAFKVTVPATGAQKAFQLAIEGGIGWASFEYNVGGTSKPGFSLGDGFGTRDVNIFKDAADTLRTTNKFVAKSCNSRSVPTSATNVSTATPSINSDVVDFYAMTALAVNITNVAVTGTPVNGQMLWIAITGTAARTITWGTQFEASTVALPTTTVSTNRLDVEFIYNTATSKWRCVRAV